jgi:hypothetical protein
VRGRVRHFVGGANEPVHVVLKNKSPLFTGIFSYLWLKIPVNKGV